MKTAMWSSTIFLAAALAAGGAFAQHSHGAPAAPRAQTGSGPHGGHAAPAAGHGAGGHGAGHAASPGAVQGVNAAASGSEASKAFAAANARMHKDMAIQFSGNADVDFAGAMIPHHQGAVDVSEIVLRFGKDAGVKRLAGEIIAAQNSEVVQMRAWLAKNSAPRPGPNAAAVKAAFEAINARMHAGMDMPMTGNPDRDFMAGMVAHHEAAVDMAKVQLRHGSDLELRKLAEDIVRSQSAEIVSMIGWLRDNGG